MRTGLFIGRFQPFHLGHRSAMDAIAQGEIDHVIIGIGSSQYSGTDKNPYTYEQREKMIRTALQDYQLPYSIVAIPDIHDAPRWVAHVESLIEKPNVIFTGNPLTKDLFEEKGYLVKDIPLFLDITGTAIRSKLADQDDTWKDMVDPNIYPLL